MAAKAKAIQGSLVKSPPGYAYSRNPLHKKSLEVLEQADENYLKSLTAYFDQDEEPLEDAEPDAELVSGEEDEEDEEDVDISQIEKVKKASLVGQRSVFC